MSTAHAALGASASHRWMECPGSIQLSEGLESPSSPYAREGTVAHNLAEKCLTTGTQPAEYVGEVWDVEEDAIEVTQEMADAVQTYVDLVRVSAAAGTQVHVETRFDLAPLNPPAPMFGTADAIVYDEANRHLHVWDYKHGQGVVVEAVDNPQFIYYALGAVVTLRVKPEDITVHVVQPRAFHPDGSHRYHTFSWADLVEFKKELMEAARATLEDNPMLVVGDHCRFCPAQAICPAQQENAEAVAQTEFAVMPAQGPPLPATLSQEQMLLVLEKGDLVEKWIASVREYAKTLLEQGQEVPGWKLVPKRAHRKWADEEAAEKYLRRKVGARKAFSKKLVSPAQAEKLLDGDLPDGLVSAESSGTNLAPEDNPRPAVTAVSSAQEDFS